MLFEVKGEKEPTKNLPGRPRSSRANRAILQAAVELLAAVGYQAMSIEAVALRAGVSKPTIYRRYASKEELVADAIETLRQEVPIPDTGSLAADIDALLHDASAMVQTPLARQTMAMIITSATSSPQFAAIYGSRYLMPRREAFGLVLERARTRGEIREGIDSGLIFDLVSGLMFHALLFEPEGESYEAYIRRGVRLLLDGLASGS
ncbi:TetR/AcrR family transcriptional regulator [Gloeobacter kilaueensis]|uniref:TetR family transcriptional regulator n=1 Tax=Gloeobacter kilaueensis (strain ATCC BAA-2537 / CCAP 1431/1 / ULC 316 / JS1) TaxID=1183438 RepID=U5QMI7_GLOK1|nr:TetR/AcrR family transcriptional regulator [Gloeobacter kilaueensis]AGY60113.1 TetR family transcriptional regulator [Gloeobacter kilaueensis JS1]